MPNPKSHLDFIQLPSDLLHRKSESALLVNDSGYKWIPDKSIDAIITDPPFNIARDTNFHTYSKNTINSYRFDEDKGWDSYAKNDFVEELGRWAMEFSRVLKPGGSFAIFCADEYLSHLITALKNAGLKPRRTVTWYKPNAVPINRSVMMMSACEYIVMGVKGSKSTFNANIQMKDSELRAEVESILLSEKASNVLTANIRKVIRENAQDPNSTPHTIADLVRRAVVESASEIATRIEKMYRINDEGAILEGCISNLILFNSKTGKRRHPTEKPVQLLRFLIALISNKSDLILDPFAGSSSLGEAALQTERRAVLVEQDMEFYETGASRISEVESSLANIFD